LQQQFDKYYLYGSLSGRKEKKFIWANINKDDTDGQITFFFECF